MSEYIHKTILPALVKEKNDNADEDKNEIHDNKLKTILKQYGLTCVSPPTVYQWMIWLGFQYEQCKKGYYVDGHELVTKTPSVSATCHMSRECITGSKCLQLK